MFDVVTAEEDDDLTLVKKMAACEVLTSTGERAGPAVRVLVDLLRVSMRVTWPARRSSPWAHCNST